MNRLYYFRVYWAKMKVALNEGNIVKYYFNKLLGSQNKQWNILLNELKRLTPEDTQEMVNSYVMETKREWFQYTTTIKNTAPHAIYVEYGVKGKAYNYHKPKWVPFYQWVGNRTFARSIDSTGQKIIWDIHSSLW